MPRFVLLRHECPPDWQKPSHWDLMLERDQVLETWQLIELPASWAQQLGLPMTNASEVVPAVRLPDHRIAYLDYEGPISENRGSVHQCDQGSYEFLSQEEESSVLTLSGAALESTVGLTQENENWQLAVLAHPK